MTDDNSTLEEALAKLRTNKAHFDKLKSDMEKIEELPADATPDGKLFGPKDDLSLQRMRRALKDSANNE